MSEFDSPDLSFDNILVYDDLPTLNTKKNVKSAVIKKRKEEKIQNGFQRDEVEFDKDKNLYAVERLNKYQKEVFDYLIQNAKQKNGTIILMNSPPGSGKTFLLLTITHHLQHLFNQIHVVIFKHDSLAQFKNSAYTHTNASFFMKLFGINNLPSFCNFELELNGNLTEIEFITVLITLIKRAIDSGRFSFNNVLYIFDEYTVISKPIFYVILQVCRYFKVSAIISGDKDQLQNIKNSKHMKWISSYDIAKTFMDKSFVLKKNERCRNRNYANIIDYMSTFVSKFPTEVPIEKFGYAFASAIFFKSMFNSANPIDYIMAFHHRPITRTMHNLLLKGLNNVDEDVADDFHYSFYYITPTKVMRNNMKEICGKLIVSDDYELKGKYCPIPLIKYQARLRNEKIPVKVDKHLPYLPLIVNGEYFLNEYKESNKVRLIKILNKGEPSEALLVRKLDPYSNEMIGKPILITKKSNNEVVFPPHRSFLLGESNKGKLYNYPIYPTSPVSVHSAQGRTITRNVNLLLPFVSHSGLYVMLSRLQNPVQANYVSVPYSICYLISTILNFPQLCHQKFLYAKDLKAVFETNYTYYNIYKSNIYNMKKSSYNDQYNERMRQKQRRVNEMLMRLVVQFVLLYDNENNPVTTANANEEDKEKDDDEINNVLSNKERRLRLRLRRRIHNIVTVELNCPCEMFNISQKIQELKDNSSSNATAETNDKIMNFALDYKNVVLKLATIPEQLDMKVWLVQYFKSHLRFYNVCKHEPTTSNLCSIKSEFMLSDLQCIESDCEGLLYKHAVPSPKGVVSHKLVSKKHYEIDYYNFNNDDSSSEPWKIKYNLTVCKLTTFIQQQIYLKLHNQRMEQLKRKASNEANQTVGLDDINNEHEITTEWLMNILQQHTNLMKLEKQFRDHGAAASSSQSRDEPQSKKRKTTNDDDDPMDNFDDDSFFL